MPRYFLISIKRGFGDSCPLCSCQTTWFLDAGPKDVRNLEQGLGKKEIGRDEDNRKMNFLRLGSHPCCKPATSTLFSPYKDRSYGRTLRDGDGGI